MPLGDLFPDELKGQNAENNLRIGSVLRYFNTDTRPPKVKRIVVVGFNEGKILFAYVFINTEINPNIFSSPRMRDLHLAFEASGREYLDHDSYVDCSQIKQEDSDAIKELMTQDFSVHIGDLSGNDIEKVVEKLKNAPTIDVKTKRKFGLI